MNNNIFDEKNENLRSDINITEKDEPIGSFFGVLRRPKTQKDGLTALIFGENGHDADKIASLHLSRFINTSFKIKIWRVKDSDGKSQMGYDLNGKILDNGKYPLLTKFVGQNKRPIPSLSGQTAQFFGLNGINADSISLLSKSAYQDNLVYIEIYINHESDIENESKNTDIDIPYDKIDVATIPKSKMEIQEIKKTQEKNMIYFNGLLNKGVFFSDSVIKNLGTPKGFKAWLTYKKCIYPHHTHSSDKLNILNVSEYINSLLLPKEYSCIPICNEHLEEFKIISNDESNNKHDSLKKYIAVELKRLLEEFIVERLHQQMNIAKENYPSKSDIEAWALSKDIFDKI